MVDMIKCDHCGVMFNPKYAVKKDFDGVTLNFCCHGCLQVYELMREEELSSQPPIDGNEQKNSI